MAERYFYGTLSSQDYERFSHSANTHNLKIINMNRLQAPPDYHSLSAGLTVPDDRERLLVLARGDRLSGRGAIIDALRNDQVVLVQDLAPEEASELMLAITREFGLQDSLVLQAGFASSQGHRQNVGKYYMTVNKRKEYQFVSPHSEGGSFTNMQLASFYCYENSSDGGETILMNTRQDTDLWERLRERVNRGRATRPLTPSEIAQIRVLLRLNMPDDTLRDDDEIISENKLSPFFSVYKALVKPKKTFSRVLQHELFAFWTTVESIDIDSAYEFYNFLKKHELLKVSPHGLQVEQLDDEEGNRIRRFGSRYDELFSSKIVHKMKPGEFIILNNLSWTHAVNNWTPGSGTRKIVAAFA